MKRRFWAFTTLAAVPLLCSSIPARAQEYSARYSGFQEVGGLGAGETGAILSTGKATLKLSVDRAAQTLTYSLTYSGLTNVLQSHIHFGKEHVAGGVMVFFCTNLGNGPAGTPACPDDSGGEVTVTGTVSASEVVGPAAQNIPPGDFAAVVAALASNTVYGNIHTKQFPAGEIRGQVHADEPDNHGRSGDKDEDDRH
ncbi:MAG TPA: CHRD domain-containing protein [Acidobacteriaceae bacterium]|nr:CHRD domain-containing protein [Acidobacteriaceae bacterium]